MVYSKLANFLHSIDLCTDVESLVRQYSSSVQCTSSTSSLAA